MSVFTPLARPELETFLAPYGLGRLLDFQGIAAGSENTNFFISLEQGEFVLTLVERGPVDEMPFFIELLDVLHDADLPVPYALRTVDGQALRELKASRRCCNRAWRASTFGRQRPALRPSRRVAWPLAPGHPRQGAGAQDRPWAWTGC
jgi:Ser/Thr protein kinase RdoA (MazF antagonist)